MYIATNDMESYWEPSIGFSAVDPNNDKVLPIKARILERQGKNIEALDIYKRLYALYPNNFELMTGVARANFNLCDGNREQRCHDCQRYGICIDPPACIGVSFGCKRLVPEDSGERAFFQNVYAGLAGVYQYMDMKAEYEVLNKIIEDGASYTLFPDRLLAYNESLKKTENVAQEQSSVPVPVGPAMLVIRVDSFIDGNNNKVIDAGESFAVQFTVENQGKGRCL